MKTKSTEAKTIEVWSAKRGRVSWPALTVGKQFAIHKTFNDDGERTSDYTVTHTKTGLAVRQSLKLQEAKRLYKVCESLSVDDDFESIMNYMGDIIVKRIAFEVLLKITRGKI